MDEKLEDTDRKCYVCKKKIKRDAVQIVDQHRISRIVHRKCTSPGRLEARGIRRTK